MAGQGIALLSQTLVAEEVAAGRLLQPFGPATSGYTYHLVTREQGTPGDAVEAVMEWLRGRVAVEE